MGVGSQEETAFAFEGDWREFAPIIFTNLLLSIVTLGLYRFWGTTRERRYLWSRTRFIDETLEWTGTGTELFIGFVMVVLILFLPIIALQFVAQALILRGMGALAGALFLAVYLVFFYVTGLAIFRALRYRLSRTHWHGIRGGSDDPGFSYGWSYTWKTIAGTLCLGLLIPWSMTNLWTERWNRMSFGPHPFEGGGDWQSLMPRFLLCYLAPTAALIFFILAAVSGGGPATGLFGVLGAVSLLAIYVVLPILALAYYAAFFRQMISRLSLSTLEFDFKARTKDWLWLFLGNAGLYFVAGVIGLMLAGTLGLMSGLSDPTEVLALIANTGKLLLIALVLLIPFALVGGFVRYRNWNFFISHLEASGEVNLAALTQSETPEPKQGEGLLDALDVGAF
jgi:uncharacterized membrane protein YjgN (DUF898 family)